LQVGRGPQQQRELGLPKIRDVVYVACPSPGREEGVADLRKALYDIAFSLTLPKGLYVYSVCMYFTVCILDNTFGEEIILSTNVD
jgi:hypothetical protein